MSQSAPLGDVSGFRILITGAGSGIGRAAAIRCAAAGAHVALVDLDERGLLSTAEATRLGGAPSNAVVVIADISDETEVERCIAETTEALGGLDGAVLNAGVQLIGRDAPVHELDAGVFDATIAVNLRGTFLVGKHVARSMINGGRGGSIVITGSPTAVAGNGRGFTAYSASKAGAHGLARVMAADLAEYGIRVNVVVPGFTATPLVSKLLADEATRAELLRAIPLARPGEADEIAAMMQFLLSADSAYATGGIFTVDGGRTAV